MTLREVSAKWAEDKQMYVKQSSYAAYTLLLYNHILPEFGDKEELTELDLQQFLMRKLKGTLSQKTVKDTFIVLKMILKFGIKYNMWPYMPPFEDLKYPTNHYKKELKTLSPADYKKIVNHIKENFTFRALGILIVLSTGMRIGEICALAWEDIDIERGVLVVNKTIQRIYTVMPNGTKKTELVIDTPKTVCSAREIPLSPDLMKILKPLMKILNSDYYVLTNDVKPTEPRTYRVFFDEYIKNLGIKKIHFHGLRHSFATQCISAKVDVKTVSAILGHSNITTTFNLYVHPSKEDKKGAVNQLFKSLKI